VLLGFDASRRLAWFAPLDEAVGRHSGELCQRHAESMVVPKGWWLDDQRVEPQLFTPPPIAHSTTAAVGRVSKRSAAPEPEPDPLPLDQALASPAAPASPEASEWAPRFDRDDDLDGLLDAGTPLLGRAFSGRPRPQGSREAT
jgi:hypothetical protein